MKHRHDIAFVLPALVVVAVFFVYPLLLALNLSFTDSEGFADYSYVGLQNYQRIFTRTRHLDAIRITLLFTLLVVVAQTGLGLLFALALQRLPAIRNLCRAALFLPAMLSFVVVGYVWQFIYSPFSGGLNALLAAAGLESLQSAWLGQPVSALICVAIAHVWMFTGYTAAIFLAGFAAIPADLTDAARLDGARGWQRFRHIELPLLAPAMTVNVVLATIGTLKTFELPFIMVRGGPDGATRTLGLQIIETLFGQYRFGLASALSMVLLVVIIAIAWVQNSYLRAREDFSR